MFGNIKKKQPEKRKSDGDGFEEWGGYMNAKITKLEDQFDEEFSEVQKGDGVSDIFKGIAIFVNGYTEPSADELRCLMLQHGGIYHHYYRSGKTTHVIASSLPNAKFNQMKSMKIVKSEWITESIKAGKLLDYKKFLLFNNFPGDLRFKTDSVATMFGSEKDISVPQKEQEMPKTAADDGYIQEFYKNSRLHHISELASMLRIYVPELRENHDGVFPGRKRLMENQSILSDLTMEEDGLLDGGVIMHIDLDCFFVSVALRNYPHLKGQPVAVTHSKGRGIPHKEGIDRKYEVEFYKKRMEEKIKAKTKKTDDNDSDNGSDNESDSDSIEEWSNDISSMSEIASCSYEAREAGVQKGMYLGVALKICPNLKTVPYDFEGYREVSLALYNTVAEYTLDIEAISCDEMYIDCNSLVTELKIHPLKFAEILRKEIEEKTKCTSSVGIASNKLLARLATKQAKPNGQFLITPGQVEEYIKDIDVRDLYGVGRTLQGRLHNLNIKTCGDLQKLRLPTLRKEFGNKTGEMLYKCCRGIHDGKVKYSHERKSVSAEVNYGIRFNDNNETEKFLRELSHEVSKRLQVIKMTGKGITLKLMYRAKDAPKETAKFLGHGVCDVVNRSEVLKTGTFDSNSIAQIVIGLYHQLGIPANELRGIGIHISKLESLKKFSKTIEEYFNTEQNQKTLLNRQEKKTKTKVVSVKQKNIVPPVKIVPAVKNVPVVRPPTISQIDFEVLNSLPEDIRLEVLREYGLTDVVQNENHPKQKLNPVQSTSQQSCTSTYKETDEGTQKLFQLTFKQMRIMIKAWVAQEQHPQPWDVSMLKEYLICLVEKKNLERLSILLKCIHRHITTQKRDNEEWTSMYNDLVDTVQNTMVNVFGKMLECDRFC